MAIITDANTGKLYDNVSGKFINPGDPVSTNRAPLDTQPIRPGYGGITDSHGNLSAKYALTSPGSLLPDIQNQLNGINLNTDALNKIRSIATGTGPSDWANLMKSQIQGKAAMDRDTMSNQYANSAASGWGQLAMRGGADAGSRERLVSDSMNAKNAATQNLNAQTNQSLLGVDVQDQSNRLDLLKGLPGMEVQALQPAFEKTQLYGQAKGADLAQSLGISKFNLGSTIGDIQGRNAFNMDQYTEQMKNWAANRQAQAQENSGK